MYMHLVWAVQVLKHITKSFVIINDNLQDNIMKAQSSEKSQYDKSASSDRKWCLR